MRLIDADEMNEKLFYRELGGKDVLITAKSVFDMIKALPTAYDVEKVVAQLEEEESKSFKKCKEEIELFKEEFWRGRMTALQKAIDIVKRGGVECDTK